MDDWNGWRRAYTIEEEQSPNVSRLCIAEWEGKKYHAAFLKVSNPSEIKVGDKININ